jgi:hypothetical protein
MLLQGRFSIFFLLFFLSCSVDKKVEYLSFSEKDKYLINTFKNYKFIYNQANDSLNKWVNDSLYITKSIFNYNFKSCWKLDSNLIFDKDSNIFFTTVLNSNSDYNDAIADAIEDFYGRKINGRWYFFFGGTSTVLPREGMQDSIYAPFSLEEMSYLAYDLKFEWMIKAINEGHPEKIDAYFEYLGSDVQECPKINGKVDWRCVDSSIAVNCKGQYDFKMTKEEIAKIQKEMAESVRPPEPPKETKQWWQFWKEEPPIPIFETEEWKNYLKQKYGKDWEKHR